eukprot:Awhi_evm1s15131
MKTPPSQQPKVLYMKTPPTPASKRSSDQNPSTSSSPKAPRKTRPSELSEWQTISTESQQAAFQRKSQQQRYLQQQRQHQPAFVHSSTRLFNPSYNNCLDSTAGSTFESQLKATASCRSLSDVKQHDSYQRASKVSLPLDMVPSRFEIPDLKLLTKNSYNASHFELIKLILDSCVKNNTTTIANNRVNVVSYISKSTNGCVNTGEVAQSHKSFPRAREVRRDSASSSPHQSTPPNPSVLSTKEKKLQLTRVEFESLLKVLEANQKVIELVADGVFGEAVTIIAAMDPEMKDRGTDENWKRERIRFVYKTLICRAEKESQFLSMNEISRDIFSACILAAAEFETSDEFQISPVSSYNLTGLDYNASPTTSVKPPNATVSQLILNQTNEYLRLKTEDMKVEDLINEETFINAIMRGNLYVKGKLVTFHNFLYFSKKLSSFDQLLTIVQGKVATRIKQTSLRSRRSETNHNVGIGNGLSCSLKNINEDGSTEGLDKEDNSELCTICLDDLDMMDATSIFTTPCQHLYHVSCFRAYVRSFSDPRYREYQRRYGGMFRLADSARRINNVRAEIECPLCRRKHDFSHVLPDVDKMEQPATAIVYNDDEPLPSSTFSSSSSSGSISSSISEHEPPVSITCFPEYENVNVENSKNFHCLVSFSVKERKKHDERQNFNLHQQYARGEEERKGIDIIMVLDVSGSMAGPKLKSLKTTVLEFKYHCNGSDRLSIVLLTHTSRRLLPLCCMNESGKAKIENAVHGIAAGGGTDISNGIDTAIKVLKERRAKNTSAAILLLTDGLGRLNVERHINELRVVDN